VDEKVNRDKTGEADEMNLEVVQTDSQSAVFNTFYAATYRFAAHLFSTTPLLALTV